MEVVRWLLEVCISQVCIRRCDHSRLVFSDAAVVCGCTLAERWTKIVRYFRSLGDVD